MDEQSKESLAAEIKNAEEVIKKLQIFATELGNGTNNNILTHLCDGLQTFLGYDKDSKGYDGTGIVYSDLDRLCDAVMGFLSGVLSNIKEHLGQHKNEIEPVITLLETNKHSGKKGFSVAIERVVEGVRGYNKAVEQSNEKIKKPINDLLSKLGNTLTDKLNDITSNIDSGATKNLTAEQVDKVKTAEKLMQKALTQCQKDVKIFNDVFNLSNTDETIKNAVNDLNSNLSRKVMYAISSVKHETERLEQLAEKERTDFDSMQTSVQEVVKDVGQCVQTKITEKVTELVREMKEGVQKIVKELKLVSKLLNGYVNQLGSWTDTANDAVDKALEMVTKILNEVDEGYGSVYPAQIRATADNLRTEADNLYNVQEYVKSQLTDLVGAAKRKVKHLEEGLMQDLHGVREAIKAKVTAVQSEIGKLHAVVEQGDASKVTQKTIAKVIEHICGKIAGIGGQSGLRGIVDGVKNCTKKFDAEEKFKSAVEGWIYDILGKEPVKGYIEQYVETNKGKFTDQVINDLGGNGIAGSFKKMIVAQMVAKLKVSDEDIYKEASKAVQSRLSQIEDGDTHSVQDYVDAVKQGCGIFATTLGKKIKHMKMLVRMIVSGIETAPGFINASHQNSTYNVNLNNAVQSTLEQLVGVSRQTGDELQGFVQQSTIGTFLDQTLADAKQLDSNLQKSVGMNAHGQQDGVNYASNVDSAITEVASELTTQLPDAQDVDGRGDPRISMEKFTLSFANPGTSGRSRGAGKSRKDNLDEAIEAIQTQVTNAVSGVERIQTEFILKSSEIHNGLNQLCYSIKQAADLDPNSAKNKLELLKNLITKPHVEVTVNGKQQTQKGLNQIHADLSDLRKKLDDGAIKLSENFIIGAGRLCEQYLQPVQDHVGQQMEKAQNLIIAQARRQYVSSVNTLLQAFADKVQKELKPLPTLIDTDRKHGFKGFMRTLEGNMGENGETSDENVDKLKGLVGQLSGNTVNHKDAFTKLSANFKDFWSPLNVYLKEEIRRVHAAKNEKINPKASGDEQLYTSKLEAAHKALNKLLDHIYNNHRYNHEVPEMLDNLSTKVDGLHPESFNEPNTPLLDGVGKGLREFAAELGKAYVSRYDGGEGIDKLSKLVTNGDNTDGKLTDDGRNFSKIFLTILEILYYNFHKFITSYASDSSQQIHSGLIVKPGAKSPNDGKQQEKIINPLGVFFSERGYKVPSDADKQDGELQRSGKMTVTQIKGFYFKVLNGLTEGTKKLLNNYLEAGHNGVKLQNLLLFFHQSMLFDYYKVCHLNIRPNPKPPTTIYEMLHWLNGLHYNPIYKKLEGYMKTWFNEFLDEHKLPRDTPFQVAIPYRRSRSMLRNINFKEMYQVFTNSTIRANDMLIAVLGHGQPDGMYACDFYTNPHNLLYPSRDSACFDLLVEVCLRVNHQIRFLYKQCHNGPSCGGWRDCIYGKGVGGSSWKCNDLQCANQKGDQKHKQTCDQVCDQKAECGLKSPLQSFLEDGLPGFLPHPFSKTSCTITCELPNHSGKPCLTPMGFTDLGLKASHRQTGKRIKEVLEGFCGTGNESLNLFCSYMVLLLRRPPQTLCDMFTFYYNLLDYWCDEGEQKKHRQDAFNEAVANANFGRPFDELNPTALFRTTVHDSKVAAGSQSTHDRGDLFSLVACNKHANPILPCGRYVQSIGDDIRLLYFQKHAGMYLSWIVYQAETFYDLLDKLYKEVCGNCEKSGDTCFGSRCDKGCTVKYPLTAEASKTQVAQQNHTKDCKSIVHCYNTHQVLFKYGFTFGSPHDLSGADNAVAKKRTCKDFCAALKSVLNKEKKAEAALAKLIYVTIPNFLWEIRQPFSYLVLALWSASFLYLIYVMVGRLDLLHIKSHLHTPSSHRIAAQSLLAAARVGRLSKIAYLQP